MAARHTKRILLVDNDEMMLDLLKISLKNSGYKLLAANDGQQAMQAVQEQLPDLIILELMLPVIDGLRFLRWLRNEQQSALPVYPIGRHAYSTPVVAPAWSDAACSKLVT